MSQLNDLIKCVVMLHNVVIAILALFVFIAALMVKNNVWEDIDGESWGATATAVLGVSGLILISTVLGCCGAYHQVERKGEFFVVVFIICVLQYCDANPQVGALVRTQL